MEETKIPRHRTRLINRPRIVSFAAVGLLAAIGWMVGLSITHAADEPTSPLDTSRSAYDQWLENERQIAEAKRRWAEKRRSLQDRIKLVQREIEDVEQQIKDEQAKIGDEDNTLGETQAEHDEFLEASKLVRSRLAELETRVARLADRLPESVQTQVSATAAQIPEDPAKTKLELQDRFKNAMVLLNAANGVHNDIRVFRESRKIDGRSFEVDTIYLGISYGFYVSDDNEHAGIGTAVSGKWVWTDTPEAAKDIRSCIAILNGDQTPAYVKLPVEIK